MYLGYEELAVIYIEKAISYKERGKYYYSLGSARKKKSKWRLSCDAFEKAFELGYGMDNVKFYKYYAKSLSKMMWHEKASLMWLKYFELYQKPSEKDYTFAGLSFFEYRR